MTRRLVDSVTGTTAQETDIDDLILNEASQLRDDSKNMVSRLCQLDPMHSRFYAFLQSEESVRASAMLVECGDVQFSCEGQLR